MTFRTRTAAGFACLAILVSACSAPKVRTLHEYGGPMPPPAHVVVYDFALSPNAVRLDQGIRSRLRRAMGGGAGEQVQAARETREVMAEELAGRLQSYGLPAERLPEGVPPPPDTLVVRGEITALNQGNRTRRVVIGFGAGASSISAIVRLYAAGPHGRPRPIQDFQGSADSGHMPGAAGTMGAGAVAGRVATSAAMSGAMHAGSESRRTGDDANAVRLARALARKIGAFAASQGWIAPAAVR